jgi:type II secretion system protein L
MIYLSINTYILIFSDFRTLQTNKTLLRTFNLLQGKYRPATHFQALRKIWQWPLLLGAGWLLVWGGFNTVQYIIGDAQSASLDKQITALYYQAYPAATSVNSPQVRIEQEMSQLKNKQQNHRSLGLIAAAGNILKQMPQTTIESFTLRENALQMHIQTKDFHALEQIVNALQKSGLQVKQSDAARSGDNVTAALSVSTGEKTDDKE